MVIKFSLKFLNNFNTFVLKSGRIDFKKYGTWAIVTGCTDGIGEAYAEILAQRNMNIVLISRSLNKLEQKSKYLNEKYSVKTKIIAVDFTGEKSFIPFYSRI
jgi:17beta-estradiol 17-dehydrogenase / very-long-chain 3-oxoacyl-CoA reductase